jgi:hypothetical protein
MTLPKTGIMTMGRIWLAPVDILTFSVGAFIPKEKSEEKPRISLQIGFWF